MSKMLVAITCKQTTSLGLTFEVLMPAMFLVTARFLRCSSGTDCTHAASLLIINQVLSYALFLRSDE